MFMYIQNNNVLVSTTEVDNNVVDNFAVVSPQLLNDSDIKVIDNGVQLVQKSKLSSSDSDTLTNVSNATKNLIAKTSTSTTVRRFTLTRNQSLTITYLQGTVFSTATINYVELTGPFQFTNRIASYNNVTNYELKQS